ncbi:unnamed protein product [Paramecium sonneborni]|uniref:Uncharacterized protein n=1 Tax=Paramecium sonneborni TaxID=65129 RepID=A0A8S1Q489_9CILI|nr:unnamed protein product [Paramecium sonneborni]
MNKNFLDVKDAEEQHYQIINNIIQNCILHSYVFISFQNEETTQGQQSRSQNLQIETQMGRTFFFREGEEYYYAGQLMNNQPIGIWMINIGQHFYNKYLVSTIFLDFQTSGRAIIIEEGQITLNYLQLIKILEKKQQSPQYQIKADQKKRENLALIKLRNRMLGCQIYNCKEYNDQYVIWKNLELINFYHPNGSQLICFGQYCKGIKNGKFFIQFRNNSDSGFQTIGGGDYNKNGRKNGKWICVVKNFLKQNQVIFEGEYRNGIKNSQWNIKTRENTDQQWQTIGGGIYDEEGRQIGDWIEQYDQLIFTEFQWNILYKNSKQKSELDLYFLESNGYFKQIQNYIYDDYQFSENKWLNQNLELILNQKIFFAGSFNQGKRVGEWKILTQDTVIGGGLFDFNGLKQGKWIEIRDNFYGKILIKQIGEYQNGRKIGKWYIQWVEILTKNNKIIGGGNYDENGVKQGIWEDLILDFSEQNQIIYKGSYKDGIRIGQWIIQSTKDLSKLKIMGGGQYDEKGLKVGIWREPCQNYKKNCEIYQSGQYQIGRKIGYWQFQLKKKIVHRKNKDDKFQDLGGGNYDEYGQKSDVWTEISQYFREDCQILFEGNYQKDKKIGLWNIKYRYSEGKDFEIIGGGNFDENGIKCGLWKDVNENFSDSRQVLEIVLYQLGRKHGKHKIEYRKIHGSQFIQICEGQFNFKGQKDGVWNELHYQFRDFCQVIKKGQYQDGIKQGKWDITFREFYDQEFVKIGGGKYDNGIKVGNWIDIDQQFCRSRQIIQKAEYIKGLRIGNCEILYRNHKTNEFQQIGHGKYDTFGNKDGQWQEPHQNFWEYFQLYQFGQYKNGIKQGLWQISKDVQCQNEDHIIAGGIYDDQGKKNKKWIDLSWNCLLSSYTLEEGEYCKEKRIGEWILKLQVYDETKLIGSCIYNKNGLKDGYCVDLDIDFFFNKCAYNSTYQNGRKNNDSKEFSAR